MMFKSRFLEFQSNFFTIKDIFFFNRVAKKISLNRSNLFSRCMTGEISLQYRNFQIPFSSTFKTLFNNPY